MSENRIITVNLPPQKTIEGKAAENLALAESFEIDSDSMLIIAAEELLTLKSGHRLLEELRQEHVRPLNEEVKYINNRFRGALTMMEQAEAVLKGKMLAYEQGHEQKRRDEQARIETAQRAEHARLAAKEEADPEQRAANEITAIVMTAPVVSPPPKLPGISTRVIYKGKVTDLFKLVCFIAKHPEHINLVKGDDKAINALAKAQRDACQVAGILVYEDKVLSARSA